MMYWIKVSQENYLQNSFRLIVVTPNGLPTFGREKKTCGFCGFWPSTLNISNSQHPYVTSSYLQLIKNQRWHFGSSINWGSRRAGQDAKKKAWLDLEFQHLDQEAGGVFGGFLSPQRNSVLGVWKREGLTTKKAPKGGSVVDVDFSKTKHHPEIFRRSFCWPFFCWKESPTSFKFKRALLGVHKRSLLMEHHPPV